MRRPLNFVLSVALFFPGAVLAQEAMRDPTRPPPGMDVPGLRGDGSGRGAAGTAEPQVQSILVSLTPGGRRVAVINGKTLRQGQRFGESVVETINPTEVVLRKGARRQVLKLFRPAMGAAAV